MKIRYRSLSYRTTQMERQKNEQKQNYKFEIEYYFSARATPCVCAPVRSLAVSDVALKSLCGLCNV